MDDDDSLLVDTLLRFLRSEPWMDRAACKGLGADAFILERGTPSDLAYMTCASCPVKPECKNFADRTGSVGIWGGELISEPPSIESMRSAEIRFNKPVRLNGTSRQRRRQRLS